MKCKDEEGRIISVIILIGLVLMIFLMRWNISSEMGAKWDNLTKEIDELECQIVELQYKLEDDKNIIIDKIMETLAKAEISAYPSLVKYTDNDPFIMSSGKRVYYGAVAVSPDLEHDYNLKFGDIIIVPGIGRFTFEDRTAQGDRWKGRYIVDIWMPSEREAIEFGRKKDTPIIIVKGDI